MDYIAMQVDKRLYYKFLGADMSGGILINNTKPYDTPLSNSVAITHTFTPICTGNVNIIVTITGNSGNATVNIKQGNTVKATATSYSLTSNTTTRKITFNDFSVTSSTTYTIEIVPQDIADDKRAKLASIAIGARLFTINDKFININ